MNIKKYAATVVMAARTHDYFGLANMLGNYLLKLIRLAAMIFIWRGLFAQGLSRCWTCARPHPAGCTRAA